MDNHKNQLLSYAKMLNDAEEKRIPPIEPIDVVYKKITLDDAYSIQLLNIKDKLSKGDKISGKKIGLTSLAMQKLLGVEQPDYGHLLESMKVTNGEITIDKMIEPKVEGEIAFILKDDITGPNVTAEDVLSATDYVVASLEIVDSRIKDWKINILDTVADNASSELYVLSDNKVKLDKIDLPKVKMSLFKNGKLINEGLGKDVLDNPANAVAWLANKLWDYNVILKKGEVILSGAITAALSAAKGDIFEAKFSDLGNVSVKFV